MGHCGVILDTVGQKKRSENDLHSSFIFEVKERHNFQGIHFFIKPPTEDLQVSDDPGNG